MNKLVVDTLMRRLVALAIVIAAGAVSLTLAGQATGAGPATSLSAPSFASASGTMSSSSYRIGTSLAELGWIGRSRSPSYSIHMGSAWAATVSTGGTVPPIAIPSVAMWGLALLAAALAGVVALTLRLVTGGAARHRSQPPTVLQ